MPKFIKGTYHWSRKELDYLTDYFQIKTNRELAEQFGISYRTVVRKARELKLHKHEDFRVLINFKEYGKLGSEHPNSIRTRFKKDDSRNMKTRFKPGHKPIVLSRKEIILRRLQKQL